ncbi:MAG: hypothetical protein O2815_09770 [Actinomycetota bacterium]|nr:hypothetical protein [Actinomycetota bacterium]
MIRWIFLIKYPEGVSVEHGEAWYLETHVAEARHLKGLRRYLTWKLEPAPEGGAGRTREQLNQWVRMTELVFDDWDAWHDAIVANPPQFTPAPWAVQQDGTASASYISETIFVTDAPQFDLLGDSGPSLN